MTSPTGYTRLQIALHWIGAALIVNQYVFKEAIERAWKALGEGVELAFNPLVLGHVAGGALVMGVALWRLGLKARLGVPQAEGDNALQNALARLTHLGLYALMLLLPLSGSLAWFGGVQLAAQAHNVLKVLMLALVVLHVVGALYHQFVLRDGVLNRMRRAIK